MPVSFMGASDAPSPAGGGSVDFSGMSYQDLYNYIASKASGDNSFGGYQVAPEYQGGVGYMNNGMQQLGGGQLFSDEPSTRQATDTEKMFARLGEVAESWADPLGFGEARQQYGNFDPRTFGAFIPSLPGGIASAPFSAASKGYEAMTGTNVESMNWDTGEISNEKLDSNQRAAVGADAFIDIVGTAIGGSGRLLSAGVNGARIAAGRGGEQIGKGLAAKAGFGWAGQMGLDIAEEGGEEFTQSLLGDIRHKQLDEGSLGRAIEGGAWGALGGAMMSGGGIALNRAMYGPDAYSADEGEGGREDAAKTAFSSAPRTDNYWEMNRNVTDQTGEWVSSAVQQATEDLPKHNDVAASASTISMMKDDSYKLTEAGLGERVLYSMWSSNIDGSRDRLVKTFSDATGLNEAATRKRLDEINSVTNTSENRAKQYNELIAMSNKPIKFAIGRNPDTNQTGLAWINLRDVSAGDGISLHRWGYMMFGGDQDGDKTQIYFGSPNVYLQGYLTRNLVSAISGKSNLNEDYIAFVNDRSSSLRFNRWLDDNVGNRFPTFNGYKSRGTKVDITADYLKKQMEKAVNDGDAQLAAVTLDQLRKYVFNAEIRRQSHEQGSIDEKDKVFDYAAADDVADNAIADITFDLESNARALSVTMTQAMKKYEAENQDSAEALAAAMNYETYDRIADDFRRVGKTNGAIHFAQFAFDLGYKISQNTNLGNPFFRQGGQTYHTAKAMQNVGTIDFSQTSQADMVNIYSQVLAFSYKLMDVGADVENSIEGVFRIAIQDKINIKWAGRRIADKSTFDEFMKDFTEIYNSEAAAFEKAWKQDTTQGFREMFGSPHKKRISGKSTSPDVARAFIDVFGQHNLDTYVSISESSPLKGRTFNQILEENASNPGRWGGALQNVEGFSGFWESLLQDYGGKRRAVGRTIENNIHDAAMRMNDMNINKFIQKNDKGVNVVKSSQFAMMTQMVDMFNLLLGPKSTLKFGLQSVESFVNTRWGNALLSGDESKMSNSLVSVWLSDQYTTAIDILNEHDLENELEWRNRFINELASVANSSALHQAIFNLYCERVDGRWELTQNGPGILQWLTSLDVSYEDKVSWYDGIQLDNWAAGTLLSDACSTSDGTIELSSVSNRLRRASRALDRAERLSYDKCKAELKNVQSKIDADKSGGYLHKVVTAMKQMSDDSYVEASIDLVASAVLSQRDVVKDIVEKGTTPNSATGIFQTLSEQNKGGVMSFLDEMNLKIGGMTVNGFIVNRRQILDVLFNKDAYIRISSPDRDGQLYLTQEKLFDEFGIKIKNKKNGPSDTEYWNLINKVPQLVSLIVPQNIDILTDGSSISTSSNKQTSFDKAIDWFIDGKFADDKKRHMYEIRNKAKNRLMNDPDWWSGFIASCDESIIENEDMNLQQAVHICERNMNRHVDALIAFASLGTGERYKLLTGNANLLSATEMVRKAYSIGTDAAIISHELKLGNMIDDYDLLSLTEQIAGTTDGAKFKVARTSLERYDIDVDRALEKANDADLTKLMDYSDEMLEQNKQDYENVVSVLLAMLDPRLPYTTDFRRPGVDEKIDKFFQNVDEQVEEFQDQINKLRNEAANIKSTDPSKSKALNREANDLEAIQKSRKEMLATVKDKMINARDFYKKNWSFNIDRAGENNDILRDNFYRMTANQAVAACKKIQMKYGMSESWSTKSEDAIKDAFKVRGVTDEKLKILRYYDNMISSRSIRNMMQGFAGQHNPDFLLQEMNAQQNFLKIAEDFKREVGDELHDERVKFSMPTFHFENKSLSYMAASGMMNMQSSSVATGISLDGAMTKLCAAVGMLSNDTMNKVKLNKRTKASRSESNTQISRMSRIVEELVNFMQEPMHLKFKKNASPGALAMICGAANVDTKFRSWYIPKAPFANEDELRDFLFDNIDKYRDDLAKFYRSGISEEDQGLKNLKWGYPEFRDIADFVTPYIEIGFENADGSSAVRIVNVVDLSGNSDVLKNLVKEYGEVKKFRPVALSIDEISAKIIRGVSAKYYRLTEKEQTKSNINQMADEAYLDWSGYNDNDLSVKDIFNKIIARGDSMPSAVLLDMTPSARQRYDEATVMRMRRSFDSRFKESKPMSETYRDNIVIPSNNMAKKALDGDLLNDNCVVNAVCSFKNGRDYSLLDNNLKNFVKNLNGSPNDIGNTTQVVMNSRGGVKNAIEIFIGDNDEEALKAYRIAATRNHPLAVPKDVAEKIMNSIGQNAFAMAASDVRDFYGHDYVILNESYDEMLSYHSHIPQGYARQMDLGRITVAVGDSHVTSLTDGGHFLNPNFRPTMSYYGANKMLLENIAGGYSLVTKIESIKDIDGLTADDFDYSFYEKRDRGTSARSTASRKEAVTAFLDRARQDDEIPYVMENVNQDECIGFIQQCDSYSNRVLIPIFYEGNVPKVADTISFDIDDGEIRVAYESNDVDFGAHNMKLNLFGAEFKSVGSRAIDIDKWIHINDFGTGIVKEYGPEVLFDYLALKGRVIDMTDNIVCNNLFYTSRKIGGNLFFEVDVNQSDPSKSQWKLKSNLNPMHINDDVLRDLLKGSEVAWGKVAEGKIRIFDERTDKSMMVLNDTIMKVTQEMRLRGIDPVLLFNPSWITYENDAKTGKPVAKDMGLNAFDMPINMILHNFSRDQVLQMFNAINGMLCPTSRDADDKGFVFDGHGQMLATNLGDNLDQTKRVMALVGPHYYTGEGDVLGNFSRGATSSYQHMVKSMLRMGVYPPNFSKLLKYLELQTNTSTIMKKTAKERLEKINFDERYTTMPAISEALARRIDASLGDPVKLEALTRYKREVSRMLEEERHPIRITMSDNKTLVTDDKDAFTACENAVKNLNDALDFDDSRDQLSFEEVAYLVKFVMGFTDNNGHGLTSISKRQFVNAVNRMAESVKSDHLLVSPGKYRGMKGDERVPMCLFPPMFSQRLFIAKAIYSHYTNDDGEPDFNKFVERQIYSMHQVVDSDIGSIKNKAKKNALRKFADALYYANGESIASGYILGNSYVSDIIESIKTFQSNIQIDSDVLELYDELDRLNADEIAKVHEAIENRKKIDFEDLDISGRTVLWRGDDATIGASVLRQLSSFRKTMGMTYLMLRPANIVERTLTQGNMSIAMKLGQTGIGVYKFSWKPKDPQFTSKIAASEEVLEWWAAMRTAELAGVEEEFMLETRNTTDMKAALNKFMQQQGLMERWQQKIMNYSSGGRRGISMQVQNFLDRMIQRAPESAPWLLTDLGDGTTILEQRLANDPIGFLSEFFNGDSSGKNPTYTFARECRNWAYKGDMAQINLASAIFSEIARRSAGIDFVTTAFVSPYFNYATNRLMRVTNFIAPISSLHYLLVEAAQGDGIIGNMTIPGLGGMKLNEVPMAGVQVHKSLREAMMIDVCHLGPGMVAIMLLSFAGAIEPPEDKDKWGNFKEWTYFGFRGDIPWWLEDCMGLVMPLMAFWKSCQLGDPRIDLIVNGYTYYLGNNPAVKVADAVQILFDPFAELSKDYDNDVEGFARAMGGPPSMTDLINGKTTGIGLSLVSQFITPGFVREIYNEGIRNDMEKSYKKVYEQDETGRLSPSGRDENDLEYTTYADAMIRKYTRNNPVMGLLADLVLKGDGDTGYLANEMPNVVYYDPAQMNSIEAFSLYNDPYTKEDPKTQEECDAIALQVISILQSHDVNGLHQIGFMLDYDTRAYVSQYIWDQIATLNQQWYSLEQSGGLDYYVAGDGDFTLGQQLVSQLKEEHYASIDYWKTLYNDKLWADELTDMTAYNRRATSYAQDANGEWYAVGYRRSGFLPVTFAPSETPGDDYKFVGPREADWQTESAVTGAWTGQRGLVPIDIGEIEPLDKPSVESWSTDGTDTGHSKIWGANDNGGSNGGNGNGNKNTGSGSRGGSSRGGGGGRRGGGGGGRGSSPSIYSRVTVPNLASPKTMNSSRNQNATFDYLRPSFQTKGSREAYRREDI